MAVKLFKAALPKGTGGRKPAELDSELYDALLEALRDEPIIEVEGRGKVPQVVGDQARLFDSEGKASSDGRRYARPITESLDKTVRVRVVDGPTKKVDGNDVPQYGWVLYIPMAESGNATGNGDTPSE